MMRRTLPAVLMLVLVAVRPAGALLTDDEPSNDSIATAAVQIFPTGAVTTDAGELTLVFDDIDYLGIGNLAVGDIVTVSTTPLDNVELDDPDTLIGLFNSGGARECENDDSINNILGSPATAGFGSLCRYVIDSAGTWFVGVTGSGDPPFDGVHYIDGVYELHVTINALVPPDPTPTPTTTPVATPTATPTPTPEPGVMLQLITGGAGLAWLQRSRKRRIRALSSLRSRDEHAAGRPPKIASAVRPYNLMGVRIDRPSRGITGISTRPRIFTDLGWSSHRRVQLSLAGWRRQIGKNFPPLWKGRS